MRVVNWDRFQHYTKRRPPWIKLHRQLLDSRQWFALSDLASRVLVECWLVASESEQGIITDDLDDLAFRLHKKPASITKALQELTAQGFIEECLHDASTALAGCLPRDRGETEERQRHAYTKEFEVVWQVHRRGPKQKASVEYERAVGNGVDHKTLLGALEKYVQTFRDGFTGAHLFRWLRDELWEESYPTSGKPTRSGPDLPVAI